MATDITLDRNADRLPTGIEVLDERLDGGLRAGSIVLLSAAPSSQSEVFLAELTRVRPTTYLTTQRTTAAVARSLSHLGVDLDGCTVLAVDDADPMPINRAYEHVQALAEGSTLIVDAMNPLERVEPAQLWAFLNGVQARLAETGSLAYLHGLTGRDVPANRDVTAYLADVVFELSTDLQGEFIENRLYVPKVRGGEPVPEVIKLELTDNVVIDTSRDIA